MVFLLTLFLGTARVIAEETLVSIDLFNNQIAPEPRTNSAMALDSKRSILYLFGGFSRNCYLNDLWSFDLEKLVWSIIYAISDSPGIIQLEPRSNSGSFFRSKTQEFCIYLGNSDINTFFDIWCFSTFLHVWKKSDYSIIEFIPLIKVKYLEYNEKEYLIILSVDNLSATIAYM